MSKGSLTRQVSLIGEEKTAALMSSSVLIFGAGGVGSYAIEAVARAGVGRITVVDADVVEESNINRQLIADYTVIGMEKAAICRDRILKINPSADVVAVCCFAKADNIEKIISDAKPDYMIDAIDSVPSKLGIIEYACRHNIGIISVMGTGNKLDPTRFRVADISKTSVCPLAKAVRIGLRKRGIEKGVQAVFSDEIPLVRKSTPASISFVPSSAGLLAAGQCIRRLADI